MQLPIPAFEVNESFSFAKIHETRQDMIKELQDISKSSMEISKKLQVYADRDLRTYTNDRSEFEGFLHEKERIENRLTGIKADLKEIDTLVDRWEISIFIKINVFKDTSKFECSIIRLMNQEELQLEIFRHTNKATSQKRLADELGYSVGKINYVIRALIEKGMIKSEKFINSQNKLQYKYLLTEDGLKEKIALTEKFVKTKKAEYDQLQRELEILVKIPIGK